MAKVAEGVRMIPKRVASQLDKCSVMTSLQHGGHVTVWLSAITAASRARPKHACKQKDPNARHGAVSEKELMCMLLSSRRVVLVTRNVARVMQPARWKIKLGVPWDCVHSPSCPDV
uniref:Uncharacterized protein n=1 Tax=Branchiostoma floridae TaxID=7739 RepID=C3YDL4_BRAFL|eukprot:XP_002605815.1 hypothetical protein BRAFLDRAFT_84429 [Branchiostoma floridae]